MEDAPAGISQSQTTENIPAELGTGQSIRPYACEVQARQYVLLQGSREAHVKLSHQNSLKLFIYILLWSGLIRCSRSGIPILCDLKVMKIKDRKQPNFMRDCLLYPVLPINLPNVKLACK